MCGTAYLWMYVISLGLIFPPSVPLTRALIPPSARSPLRDCSASEGESDEREAAFIHLSFRAPPRSHGFPTRSAGSAVEAQFLLFPFQIQPFFFFFFPTPLPYVLFVNHLSRHQLHSFISLDCRASRLRESSGLVFIFSYLRCLR